MASRLPPCFKARSTAWSWAFVCVCVSRTWDLACSIWANRAWGTYWSWDPKETWALITWLFYGLYLHARYMHGWKGRKAAWLAIVGFCLVLFTYFGVNYLLAGLHSYA